MKFKMDNKESLPFFKPNDNLTALSCLLGEIDLGLNYSYTGKVLGSHLISLSFGLLSGKWG